VEAVQRRAARYVANNHRNRSTCSVSNIIQRLKWRPLAHRRKDARLVMLYKIDRELVAINKENRLIPRGRKTRQAHNRSFQIPSSRIDTRKMSFFPRTVRDWNLRGAYSRVKILCVISNKTTPHLKLMTGYDLFLRPYHFRDKHNFLSDPHAIKMTTFAFIF
jgi:hypothetical protein